MIEQFEQGHPSALLEDDYCENFLGTRYLFAGKTDRTYHEELHHTVYIWITHQVIGRRQLVLFDF